VNAVRKLTISPAKKVWWLFARLGLHFIRVVIKFCPRDLSSEVTFLWPFVRLVFCP